MDSVIGTSGETGSHSEIGTGTTRTVAQELRAELGAELSSDELHAELEQSAPSAPMSLPVQSDRHHARSAPVPAYPQARERRRPVALPVTVVIPTWNEGKNIGHVLEQLPPVEQLIIVDANSDDGTLDVVRRYRPDATVLLQAPSGKGNATRAGLEVATAENIICMDADGSMDPREIPAFLALLSNGYDMVKGSRGAVGGGSTDFTPLRRAGNRGLVGIYNLMFGTNLSDITFGYIGFRREVLPRLGLYAEGFEIEVQMVAHAQLAGLRFAELPSRETDRLTGDSHLRTFKDGHRVLRTIVRSRVAPGREWWRHVGSEPLRYDVAPKGSGNTLSEKAR
ncbi:glycosyltransferase family 2 protein [Nocardioides mangrovicus]|uniref:Glycosyltransferase family 2 protein n=1 Tax=Nocardioides mangrovicus TaxID=2478913 RepID=A0A3L8P1V4_9ACTN|nr:glycosyltransferase family 2 protein [Nocardioides mangrovicus]RLV49356.1 glycosyltransferase family 2 protein [Nocardioides mangrovicus]